MNTRSSRLNRSRRRANSCSSITSFMQRGAEGRGAILLVAPQFLAEPGHRTIEMMQVETVGAVDAIVLPPAIGGPIRAAAHQAMQHGEEHRAFQRETWPRPRASAAMTLGSRSPPTAARTPVPGRCVAPRRRERRRSWRHPAPSLAGRTAHPSAATDRVVRWLRVHPAGRVSRSPAGAPDHRCGGSPRSAGRCVPATVCGGSTCATR